MLSPAIAQKTGVNKSVSFARWQQGAGFVVPRTATCYYVYDFTTYLGFIGCVLWYFYVFICLSFLSIMYSVYDLNDDDDNNNN